MLDFTNKIVVITGGGSGIGKAVALAFAKQGASVHIVEVNSENAKGTVTEIKKNNGKAGAHICDVSNQHQVAKTFKAIGKKWPASIRPSGSRGLSHANTKSSGLRAGE